MKAMLSVKSDPPCSVEFDPPSLPIIIECILRGRPELLLHCIEYSVRFDEKPCLKSFPGPSLTLGDELTYLGVTQHFFPVEEIFQTFKIILGIQVPIKSKLIH